MHAAAIGTAARRPRSDWSLLLLLLLQVGLTNMDVAAVSKIVDAGVPVANNQVRPMTGSVCFEAIC
jgi:hypothetical protein